VVSNRLGVNHNIHDCFEGAIGELNAPSSIKTILRPHQQTGIVFLWNCLTSACPKLQKLLQERRVDVSGKYDYGMDGGICHDELRGGAILADEMGKWCFYFRQ
jgi:SNF2 family DNA or RNA helicase